MSKVALLVPRPSGPADVPIGPYRPTIYADLAVNVQGRMGRVDGVIRHGSRSPTAQGVDAEFDGTRRFGRTTPYAWNFTVGNDAISQHMAVWEWAWHARAASRTHIGVEFAQSGRGDWVITDAQIRAFAYIWRHIILPAWPHLDYRNPRHMPTHAEVEVWGLTGYRDGKTDAFPYGDPRAEDMRQRIIARLDDPTW